MTGVRRRHRPAPPASGVTLIELMVALVLGLIVSGAALALFATNRQTYVASESLNRVQENARTAFEQMSRDVREAAGNACGAGLSNTVNVLENPTTNWYTNFVGGIRGYNGSTATPGMAFGSTTGLRVNGTDAVDLTSVFSDGVTIDSHNPTSAQFSVNTKDHGLNSGDVVMACDADHAAIFQVTNASPGTNVTIVHNKGTGTPGNCTKGLGSPLLCTANGTAYQFGCKFGGVPSSGVDCSLPENKWTAIIAKLKVTRWYIGCNGRMACSDPRGRSLYQSSMRNNAGVLVVDNNEITEGVAGMTLGYLTSEGTAYQSAAAITDWSTVVAVSIQLDMTGQEKIGTNSDALQRNLDHVVAIRNRAP